MIRVMVNVTVKVKVRTLGSAICWAVNRGHWCRAMPYSRPKAAPIAKVGEKQPAGMGRLMHRAVTKKLPGKLSELQQLVRVRI